jgi:hypothetical protein
MDETRLRIDQRELVAQIGPTPTQHACGQRGFATPRVTRKYDCLVVDFQRRRVQLQVVASAVDDLPVDIPLEMWKYLMARPDLKIRRLTAPERERAANPGLSTS